MHCVITGDSHTGALQLGLNRFRDSGYHLPITIKPLGAGALLNESFFAVQNDLIRITRQDTITALSVVPEEGVTAYGFSGPLHLQPVVLDRFFHDPRAKNYTQTLLRHAVLDRKHHSLKFIQAILSLGLPVFIIEPPYTFRHHPRLQENIRVKRRIPRVAEMERACREVMKAELRNIGASVIDLPAEALTEEGIMSDFYRHPHPEDKHHGNVEYGAMMIKECMAFLKQPFPSSVCHA